MVSLHPDLDVRRPFTRATALASGLTDADLRGHRRIFHGVYVHRDVEVTPQVRVEAALLLHPPTAYASHFSAAAVYELPTPPTAEVHVTVLDRRDRRRAGTFRHHLAPPGARVRTLRGLRVSPPAQLFCELAEHLGLVDLVVVGDALVRWHGVTPAALVEAAEKAPRRLRRRAGRAAALVRAEVDSPMETKVRLLLVLAGLPEPDVNVTVRWPDGRVRYRFDLCYRKLKLVIEYDGRQHRADLDQWDHDIARRDWMDSDGWSMVAVVARGVYRHLPRRLSDEWRAHFPVVP